MLVDIAQKPPLSRLLRNRWVIRRSPFYRRYPFQSKASIRSADARGCVDLDMGFFCNRIPKAANSTVVASLASLKLGREVGSKEAKKLFINPSALSPEEFEKFEALYKFAFVRNPFSRTLSAYLDKVRRKQNTQGANDVSSVSPETSANVASGATSEVAQKEFCGFLQSLKAGNLFRNAHWAPQTSILLVPVSEFDFIGKVETLDRDLLSVLETLARKSAGKNSGSSDCEKINEVRSNATGANSKLARYYNEESTALVQSLYAKDFELLGYAKEPNLE